MQIYLGFLKSLQLILLQAQLEEIQFAQLATTQIIVVVFLKAASPFQNKTLAMSLGKTGVLTFCPLIYSLFGLAPPNNICTGGKSFHSISIHVSVFQVMHLPKAEL